MNFERKPKRVFWLLNHTPHDGCLLVFNAVQCDWRTKACDFARRHGFRFSIHAISGATRELAHDRTKTSDLYVTLRGAS